MKAFIKRSLRISLPAYLHEHGYMEGSWRTTPVGVIRKRFWKLLEFFLPKESANRWESDHLQDDIGERVNPAGENPDKVRGWLRDLGQRRETLGATVSEKPNPGYDKRAEPDGFD